MFILVIKKVQCTIIQLLLLCTNIVKISRDKLHNYNYYHIALRKWGRFERQTLFIKLETRKC